MEDKKYMALALELAQMGQGTVSPNPMVGAVIVSARGVVIGQGYHQKYGEAHAEVRAVESVQEHNLHLLPQSTMYVNLEPCSHWGKTPPCCDLIISKRLHRVVVGSVDCNPEVAGKGIRKMQQAGIEVTVGVLETESLELNARFFTTHYRCRPYIILKWAQTTDGFLDAIRPATVPARWMTSPQCKALVHLWRAQEDAIMVGHNTALMDNPELTVRMGVNGQNPLRIVLDQKLDLSRDLKLFNDSSRTILFTSPEKLELAIVKFAQHTTIEPLAIDFKSPNLLNRLLGELSNRRVQSLIVEGGQKLLSSFIEQDLWDEARIFTSALSLSDLYPTYGFDTGVEAPSISASQYNLKNEDKELNLKILRHKNSL